MSLPSELPSIDVVSDSMETSCCDEYNKSLPLPILLEEEVCADDVIEIGVLTAGFGFVLFAYNLTYSFTRLLYLFSSRNSNCAAFRC